MHAPHHVTPEWVDPYRGVFDKGWDSWREELFARQVAAGIVPEGTVLTPRPEWVQAWSELSGDERRLLSPAAGGLRGVPDPHRRPDRPRPLVAREPRRDGQHARHGVLRQRRQCRGGQDRQRQRAPVQRPPPRVAGRQPRPLRRLGRVHHLQPLLVGLGLGRQHPAQALEALHLARRHPHAAHRPLGRSHRAPRRRALPVRARRRPHAHDHGRRRAGDPRRGGRRGAAGPRRRQPARGARGPRRGRAAPHPVLRDDGLALHLPRRVEGHDGPHQHRRPRRGGARRRQPRLHRGPLGALRPVGGLLGGDRRVATSTRSACAPWRTCGPPRRSGTTSCPCPTASSIASAASSPRPGRRGRRAPTGPVAARSPTSRSPSCSAASA